MNRKSDCRLYSCNTNKNIYMLLGILISIVMNLLFGLLVSTVQFAFTCTKYLNTTQRTQYNTNAMNTQQVLNTLQPKMCTSCVHVCMANKARSTNLSINCPVEDKRKKYWNNSQYRLHILHLLPLVCSS